MRKIKKALNIALILTLIGVMLPLEVTYARDSLRPALLFSDWQHERQRQGLPMFIQYVTQLQKDKKLYLLDSTKELSEIIDEQLKSSFLKSRHISHIQNNLNLELNKLQWHVDEKGGVWVWYSNFFDPLSKDIYLYISPDSIIQKKTFLEVLDAIVDCRDLKKGEEGAIKSFESFMEDFEFQKGIIGLVSVKNKTTQEIIGYLQYNKLYHLEEYKACSFARYNFHTNREAIAPISENIIFIATLKQCQEFFDVIQFLGTNDSKTKEMLKVIGFIEKPDGSFVWAKQEKDMQLDEFMEHDSREARFIESPYESGPGGQLTTPYNYAMQGKNDEALTVLLEDAFLYPSSFHGYEDVIEKILELLEKGKFKCIREDIAVQCFKLLRNLLTLHDDKSEGEISSYVIELLGGAEEIEDIFQGLADPKEGWQYSVCRIPDYVPISCLRLSQIKKQRITIYINARYKNMFKALPVPLQKKWASYIMEGYNEWEPGLSGIKDKSLLAMIHMASCLQEFLGEPIDLKRWLRSSDTAHRNRLDFLMRLALIVDTAQHMPVEGREQLRQVFDRVRLKRREDGVVTWGAACTANTERSQGAAACINKFNAAFSLTDVRVIQGGFHNFMRHRVTESDVGRMDRTLGRINPNLVSDEPGRGHVPLQPSRSLTIDDIHAVDILNVADGTHKFLAENILSGILKGRVFTIGEMFNFCIDSGWQEALRYFTGQEILETGQSSVSKIFAGRFYESESRMPTTDRHRENLTPIEMEYYIDLVTALGPMSMLLVSGDYLADGGLEALSDLPMKMYNMMNTYKTIEENTSEIKNAEDAVRKIKEKADEMRYDEKNAPQFVFMARDMIDNFPGFFETWSNWPVNNIKICYENEEEHALLLDLAMLDFLPLRIQLISREELSIMPQDKTHLVGFQGSISKENQEKFDTRYFKELGPEQIVSWPKVFIYMSGAMDIKDDSQIHFSFDGRIGNDCNASVDVREDLKKAYIEHAGELCAKIRENVQERIKKEIPLVDLSALYRYSAGENPAESFSIKHKLNTTTQSQL